MAELAYYLVFYLHLHACTARLLLVSDKKSAAHLKFSSQDVETSDNNGSDRFSIHKDANNQGESTKGVHTLNILHQPAAGREIWKRSMLASNMEESVSSRKDVDAEAVEDIEVMDYAQPHRKPPIHNKGT